MTLAEQISDRSDICRHFQIPHFLKRRYHHIKDLDMFTYKMSYKNIFLSTGFYKEIATVSYNHDLHTFSDSTSIQNYASVTLLKKEDLSIAID